MKGGPGDDVYSLTEAGDVVIEQPSEGTAPAGTRRSREAASTMLGRADRS